MPSGGVFKCMAAGMPGTWKHIQPASATADPSSGTMATGYPEQTSLPSPLNFVVLTVPLLLEYLNWTWPTRGSAKTKRISGG